MKSRAERINRIHAILKLQYRISEWHLVQLRQREKELQDREAYLIGALNDKEPPKGLSTEAIARRLSTTGVSTRAVQTQAENQLDQLRTEARRLKATERMFQSAAWAARRDAEKRSLADVTEALTVKPLVL